MNGKQFIQNYSFIVETWLTKSESQDLRNSITPGATSELFSILDRPYYYDTTWQGNNTLTFTPTGNSSNLKYMKNETTGFVRNITTSPLEGDSGWIFTKLECYASGSGGL